MNVIVYSTSTCSTCHIVTEWLEKHSIPYVKKNTDEDQEAMLAFMAVNDGMISVPFTVISDDNGDVVDKISGYDQNKLKTALGIV